VPPKALHSTVGTAAPAALPRRLAGIDVLRALAASAVVVGHLACWHAGFKSGGDALSAVWRLSSQLGSWGVGIFFVLSGTCIHLPVARALAAGEPVHLDVGAYFKRRLRRIYPPHAIVIGLSWLVAARTVLPPGFEHYLSVPTAGQFWAHVFLVHTFVPGAIYSINSVLWTIAIESHFYLVYPLLLRLRRRLRMETLLGGLFLLMLALRALDLVLPPALKGVLTSNFPGLLWQWVLGAVIAERLARRPPAPLRPSIVVVVAALSAVVTCVVAGAPHGILLLALFGPLTYGVVVFMASAMRFSSRGLAMPALEWIGVRSYSLYLTHPIALTLVVALLSPSLRRQPLLLAGIAFVAAYLMAVLYFVLVEKRFLYRGRSVTPAQTARPVLQVGVGGLSGGPSDVEPGL
jgi:peptidoglycan/LPS O-acetylase OafA/YrhL